MREVHSPLRRGGGGGSSLNPQRPTIITDGNLKYTLSKDGTSASLTPNDGYEINSIIDIDEEHIALEIYCTESKDKKIPEMETVDE